MIKIVNIDEENVHIFGTICGFRARSSCFYKNLPTHCNLGIKIFYKKNILVGEDRFTSH